MTIVGCDFHVDEYGSTFLPIEDGGFIQLVERLLAERYPDVEIIKDRTFYIGVRKDGEKVQYALCEDSRI